MITSFFPGRIRLRAEIFKDLEITNTAIAILKTSQAVRNVEYNHVTGSILLEYVPSKVPLEKLKPLLPFLQKLEREAKHYSAEAKPRILLMLNELNTMVKNWDADATSPQNKS